MTEFEQTQLVRPEFTGTQRKSVIDGLEALYMDPYELFKRQLYSVTVISMAMFGVVCCVSFIFYMQILINSMGSASVQSFGSMGVSVFSAIQIIVLEYYYSDLAKSLNDQENHRRVTASFSSVSFTFINCSIAERTPRTRTPSS